MWITEITVNLFFFVGHTRREKQKKKNVAHANVSGHEEEKKERKSIKKKTFLDEPFRPCDGATAHIKLKGINKVNLKP